jgi:ribosomal protein L4
MTKCAARYSARDGGMYSCGRADWWKQGGTGNRQQDRQAGMPMIVLAGVVLSAAPARAHQAMRLKHARVVSHIGVLCTHCLQINWDLGNVL